MPRLFKIAIPALTVLVALVVLLGALAFGGGSRTPALGDPGVVVRVGLPIAKLLVDLSAATMIGSLALALWAFASRERAYVRSIDIAAAAALVMTLASAATGFLTFMNVSLTPFSLDSKFGNQLGFFFTSIQLGQARAILMVNPEICTGHLNFRDRDSHFIFGDVATAILVEAKDMAPAQHWEILGTRLKTQFSNNIRNNFGFLNRAHGQGAVDQSGPRNDKLFVQEGRKVFKEVVPMVGQMIVEHADSLGLSGSNLRRMWLHQANTGMNRLIAQKVLGHEANEDESPTVLDTYANTSSAGSIIAFHKHNEDLIAGDIGLICSFGAGYSAGSVFVRKVA